MRDRAWRRYKTEVKIINRLRIHKTTKWWYRGFIDANGHNHSNPEVSNFLGTDYYFESKSISTPNWRSEDKCKYSSNRQKGYWRSGKGPFRERDTRELLKILKENGLK